MINFIIRRKKNNLSQASKVMYYPQISLGNPMTLAQVIKQIEKQSTVSSADIKAVLDALQNVVIDALQNGTSVRLNDLGSFRLTIKAGGAETAAEARRRGVELIKSVSVQFTKSGAMRKAFMKSNLEFSLQADKQSDTDTQTPAEGDVEI